jgi:putative ATP-dependent endonuclease of OLD family
MEIKDVEIKNFRSLKDVKLTDIGGMAVFIGANSSGKSNLLEALRLFFDEIDPQISRNVGALLDYMWFERKSDEPIVFNISLRVNKGEASNILPPILHNILEIKDENVLTVIREIKGPHTSASWNTSYVKFGDTEIIKEGKVVLSQEKLSAISTEGQPPVTPDQLLGLVLQSISKELKGKFRIIYAARNYTATPSRVGERVSIIPSSILSEISTLATTLDRDRTQEAKWRRLEEDVGKTTNIEDIRVLSGRPLLKEPKSDTRIPFELTGGGYQEIIGLLHQLNSQDGIIGLEEPEIHLHPHLARRFFEKLKEFSKHNQVLIATHSTLFVDVADLQSVWLVTKRNSESIIKRAEGPEELKAILYDLGVRPSDIFFANGIIFVEGETEKSFFSQVAKKMGIDTQKFGLSIIPTYGKNRGRYHLDVWIEAAKSANIPFFMIFDKDAEEESKKFVNGGVLKPNDNLFILKKGSIEDYYPEETMLNGLGKILGVEFTSEEKEKLRKSPRAKSIEELAKEKKERKNRLY